MKIVKVPNPVLSTPTQPVTLFDSALKKLIKEMKETLNIQVDPQGVGLAANQVGVSLSLFLMKPDPEGNITVCINPQIVEKVAMENKPVVTEKKKRKKNEPLEGCLSIPRIWSPVKRSKKVLLTYFTETGEKKTQWFAGFEAVIVEHEVDHLAGVVFTQRAIEQNASLYEERDEELKKIEY